MMANTQNDNIFGERLAECLKKRDVKQRTFAKAVGVTEVSMSRYINGMRKPNTKVLTRIANELHVTSDMLLGKDTANDPETAFNLTALLANDYASRWTRKQRLELMNIIFGKDEAR